MKIVPIFGEILFAVQYPCETEDAFKRLFNSWADPEYLEEFFENNKADITNGYYGTFTVEGAIFETYEYAEELESRILALAENSKTNIKKGLEEIFKPLHTSDNRTVHLKQSKARNRWLRIYALRIERNVYIVTGGVIKLTRTMQERQHTMDELSKLNKCRTYLTERGIIDIEGIIEEIEI
ncbi:MAG: hypothetical protein K9J30_10155 [Bacteroidales bacterium]|nr:hypothetical protein [Bacteroidales bacterium]